MIRLWNVLTWIGEALFLFFPAYVANATPVLLGGGPPLDLRRRLADKKPLFGPHKTIRGSLSGIITGTTTGIVLFSFFSYQFQYEAIPFGLLLSLGAMTGDLCGSFIKRRMDKRPGSPFFPLDQLSFVVGAIAFLAAIYVPPIEILGAILVITPPIHVVTNRLAHVFGIRGLSSR